MFDIDGDWITRRKCLFERFVEKLIDMRQCGCGCFMRFVVIRHNLRPSYPPNPLRRTFSLFIGCQTLLPLQAPEPGPVQFLADKATAQ